MRLAILLLVAGCDWQLHRMQEQPRCETGGTFRGESCMQPAPEGVVAMAAPPTPPPLTRELVVRRAADQRPRVEGKPVHADATADQIAASHFDRQRPVLQRFRQL